MVEKHIKIIINFLKMFNNITLSEEEFKDILNGSYNHLVNDYNFNIFNKRNSDIWKNIKTFEIGFIVDEISEYFNLSKTIEHFVKNFVFQNGFLRFKKINNCEYIEIVCLFDNDLISNLKDKLLLSSNDVQKEGFFIFEKSIL